MIVGRGPWIMDHGLWIMGYAAPVAAAAFSAFSRRRLETRAMVSASAPCEASARARRDRDREGRGGRGDGKGALA